jgi:hypothetical protein
VPDEILDEAKVVIHGSKLYYHPNLKCYARRSTTMTTTPSTD